MPGDVPFLRRAAGSAAGTVTAVAAAGYLVVGGAVAGPAMLWPRTRAAAVRRFTAGARWLTGVERRRREVFFGDAFPAAADGRPGVDGPGVDRPGGDGPGVDGSDADRPGVVAYLSARAAAGLVSAVVAGLIGIGLVLAGVLVAGVVRGSAGGWELAGQVVLGGVLLFLAVQGLIALAGLDDRLARRQFGPSESELLRRRIADLSASRAGVVLAVDRERRRIERDLHDGVQQRLVALAMLLGRARRHRDPEQAARLLEQAHRQSEEALGELREVAWRAYPSALDTLGLPDALAGVAERSSVPVRLDVDLPAPLPRPVETAAYFVVSEEVTNAVKHAGASAIVVEVRHTGGAVRVRVTDDGAGGADPDGSGLSGLGLRIAALDGRMDVRSPAGGPTEITVEMPCD